MSLIKSLTFFGSARTREENSVFQDAYETAAKLAEHKLTVVNGGGPGEMLAATFGAKSAGGKVKVVYYTPQHATTFEGKNKLNAGDEEFEESNYILRTKKLLELGDAYVIFRGGSGTISEFGMAWGLAKLYFGHHKPLILYGEFWHDIIRVLQKHMITIPNEYKVLTVVTTPDEVMDAILKYEVMIKLNRHSHVENTGDEGGYIL
ncbi:hypothetical protein A2690_00675 [Candidatus Roizmanbacteria bacterium RIFCSPHIGHO2_01_FULL_39_12b]|uniref:Lysine decarboxylase n=1 Tax=Candidatus Roizmanbacteria bacterium RIFCSPHIGHO2_01_FULL_39_12b TaxID=1802030 RepID=A0A1F7GAM1_9BACT|nr:MAG: hypothetical protein A2690_00675 [Candidatus Roizmanbacteria bacterium RIFCSPHIGHO2_01_FULL_39_12b]